MPRTPLFFLSTLLVLVTAACQNKDTSQPQGPPQQQQTPLVDVAIVRQGDIAVEDEYFGRTVGYQEVEIHARVEGILLERKYEEGAKVQKGDILFVIEPRQYQAAVDLAEARVRQEQARLKQAQLNWTRISTLFQEGNVTERERDQAEFELESSEAGLALAEAQLRTAQINLDYTTVEAPIPGITSRKAISEGSLLRPGTSSSLLTRITRTDPIYVIFTYTDSDYIERQMQIEQGTLRYIDNQKLTARIIMPNDSFYEETGVVDFTEINIDRNTGTVEARAVFENPQQKLLPGQFVRVKITGLVRTDAVVIPQRCVMQDTQGQYVYRLDDENIAHTTRIKTGPTTGTYWVVESGLSPGERIISNGLLHVIPEQKVKVDKVEEENPFSSTEIEETNT